MSKTCVLIMGTNATGKTSLVKALINHYGGIGSSDKTLTVCNDPRISLAGHYDLEKKYGGVDGFNQTRCLEGIVRNALQQHEAIICEGSYFDTFGMNLLNAAFAAKKQLVVLLYAPPKELNRRLLERAGAGVKESVLKKQRRCVTAAKKWASIGVPVLSFDTSVTSSNEIVNLVIQKIEKLLKDN